MRVCDITKTDEHVAVVAIVRFDEDVAMAGGNELHKFDVGKRALDAFEAGDWHALGELAGKPVVPVKNPRRVEGARKAAQTRRERKAERERQLVLEGAPT